jgi:chorismate synthase
MVAEIEAAKKDGDTLGGVVEVLAYGLPPGLGSHVHWDRRLDARLAAALMGIQAIKGVEVGDGFQTARRRGSAAHDEMVRGEDGVIRARDRPGRRHRGRHVDRPARCVSGPR